MSRLVTAIVLMMASSISFAENQYLWQVMRVIDGDTVKFKVDFLPRDLKPELNVRVKGIDTPEKAPRAKCYEESQLAEKASKFTKDSLMRAKTVIVSLYGWDKYGGRVLGEIYLDNKPLSKMLIENGLAREYDGGTKASWCDF